MGLVNFNEKRNAGMSKGIYDDNQVAMANMLK